MPKFIDPSKIPERVAHSLSKRSAIGRVNSLCKLAIRVGHADVEAVLAPAVREATKIDEPGLRDSARDLIVDAMVELMLYDKALAQALKMDDAFTRACAYASIRHVCTRAGETVAAKKAAVGFEMARNNMEKDDLPELAEMVKLIEKDSAD